MPIPRPGPGEEHSTFVGRCMSDEVMRREYPDEKQRAAICYRQVAKTTPFAKVFDMAKACCKAAGADVPAVEAVIGLLLPLISTAWDTLVTALVIETERQMRGLSVEYRTSDLAVLLTAYVSRLERIVQHPLSGVVTSKIEAAVAELAQVSANMAGLVSQPSLGIAQSLGSAQLSLQLTAQAVRAIETAAPVASRFLQEGLGLGSTEEAIATWRDQLRGAFNSEAALEPLLDSWAYQTFNATTVRAAAAAGENYIQLVAKIDEKTTAFCRIVNGRVIPIAQALAQLGRIQDAILAGDVAALQSAAPFFPNPSQATAADVQAVLDAGGLAPFHFDCRTRNVPVRFTSG